jgi:hypothetical protein
VFGAMYGSLRLSAQIIAVRLVASPTVRKKEEEEDTERHFTTYLGLWLDYGWRENHSLLTATLSRSGSGAAAPTGLLPPLLGPPPLRGPLTPVSLVQREYHLPTAGFAPKWRLGTVRSSVVRCALCVVAALCLKDNTRDPTGIAYSHTHHLGTKETRLVLDCH